MICAIDGELEDTVGTSSYAFFSPKNSQAVISGRAGEYQPWEHASSTRQELFGQLGVQYWMSRFCQWWGIPRNKVYLTLITDSQVSIDIIQNLSEMVGIKNSLKPEMDVAFELYQLRLTHFWLLWNVIRVESHIDESEASAEFNWACNEYVDALATKA